MPAEPDRRWARWIATTGGLGDLLPAPGTFAGSLPAALVWWGLMAVVPGMPLRIATTTVAMMAAVVAGIWAGTEEAARRGNCDPGPVVIDEVAGQWLTYLLALPFIEPLGWSDVLGGFILFRIADILKPWPARRLERLHGGLGIMADDLAAGVWAGALLAALSRWLPV